MIPIKERESIYNVYEPYDLSLPECALMQGSTSRTSISSLKPDIFFLIRELHSIK